MIKSVSDITFSFFRKVTLNQCNKYRFHLKINRKTEKFLKNLKCFTFSNNIWNDRNYDLLTFKSMLYYLSLLLREKKSILLNLKTFQQIGSYLRYTRSTRHATKF